MKKPKICAVIMDNDLQSIKAVEPRVDLFEVRMDLIGDGWRNIVGHLSKPWIACARSKSEGGKTNERSTDELLEAIELGANIVDMEYRNNNLGDIVPQVKKRAKCLVSFHDIVDTPLLDDLRRIVAGQLEAGADICKVVTTARRFEDNLTVLGLIRQFPKTKIVSFAMGEAGFLSRVLCPLVGGYFTYASIERGKESAPGQLTVRELSEIYRLMRK